MTMTTTTIRPEAPGDRDPIYHLHREAFGGDAESRLVDALRESPAFIPELSLVALDGVDVVGHILFTRVEVEDEGVAHPALALAPMGVLPARQNLGIGSALVRRGLEDARRLGHGVVIVLGDPEYYPRFGFRPAGALGIRSPFEAPPEAFLAMELSPGALSDVHGLVRYPPEFFSS
jgi:putative acetyltransferase